MPESRHTAQPPTAPQWAQLAQQLGADDSTTRKLIQVLRDERQSLAERDYQRFQTLLEQKRGLLETLELGQQLRGQWLQRTGFASEKEALASATQTAPDVADRWQELAAAWQQCQDLNRGNEQIAQRTRLVVGRLLDMMRGSPAANALYDASGQARSSGPGQRLGDA